METGGVSKSITSLLNVIDRTRYDISLMLISPKGAFMELLPSDLRLITNPVWTSITNRHRGCLQLIKSGRIVLALGCLLRYVVSIFSKAKAAELIAAMMPAIDEEFDTIVDFNGQQQLYYMINKLHAKKKITFFHSDYEQWPYYYNADKKYFRHVDYIFSISPKCVESLRKFFPDQANKINLMENITSIELIDRMADVEVNDLPVTKNNLLTVGHVCENKGILFAIEAAAIMKTQGIDFHWYFLGSIDKPEEYATLIRQQGVSDYITFLGIRSNPYPYIKAASIIVHPSKFEGRSIALDEAKLLCKPVVVTNFSTVNDQFTNRHNASICRMNAQSIADAIKELLHNDELQQLYVENLRASRIDNSSEVEKLYTIFES